MIDGPGRRTVKAVVRAWFYALMVPQRAALRAVGKVEWDLGGACARCAHCCEQPSMRVERLVYNAPWARSLFLWWQQTVNGFHFVEEAPGRVFRFRCTHFDAATRSCDSYASRPGMCRDYPRTLLHATNPSFLDGCGYRAVARNSDDIQRALAESDLDPEKVAELERKLRAK